MNNKIEQDNIHDSSLVTMPCLDFSTFSKFMEVIERCKEQSFVLHLETYLIEYVLGINYALLLIIDGNLSNVSRQSLMLSVLPNRLISLIHCMIILDGVLTINYRKFGFGPVFSLSVFP